MRYKAVCRRIIETLVDGEIVVVYADAEEDSWACVVAVEDCMPTTRIKTFDDFITLVGGYYHPEPRAGGPVDFECYVGTEIACKSAFHDNDSYRDKVELALWDLAPSGSGQTLQFFLREKPRAVAVASGTRVTVAINNRAAAAAAVRTTLAGVLAAQDLGDDCAAGAVPTDLARFMKKVACLERSAHDSFGAETTTGEPEPRCSIVDEDGNLARESGVVCDIFARCDVLGCKFKGGGVTKGKRMAPMYSIGSSLRRAIGTHYDDTHPFLKNKNGAMLDRTLFSALTTSAIAQRASSARETPTSQREPDVFTIAFTPHDGVARQVYNSNDDEPVADRSFSVAKRVWNRLSLGSLAIDDEAKVGHLVLMTNGQAVRDFSRAIPYKATRKRIHSASRR